MSMNGTPNYHSPRSFTTPTSTRRGSFSHGSRMNEFAASSPATPIDKLPTSGFSTPRRGNFSNGPPSMSNRTVRRFTGPGLRNPPSDGLRYIGDQSLTASGNSVSTFYYYFYNSCLIECFSLKQSPVRHHRYDVASILLLNNHLLIRLEYL